MKEMIRSVKGKLQSLEIHSLSLRGPTMYLLRIRVETGGTTDATIRTLRLMI